MIIVIAGNPIDGLQVFGPFEDTDAAIDWCEEHCNSDSWWTTVLYKPTR